MNTTEPVPLAPGRFENWHQWRAVEHGQGALGSLGRELDRLGITRVLLVSTRSLRDQGALIAAVRTEIGDRLVGEFSESDQHVPRNTVVRALEIARAAAPDGVVSFGGSSVVDTAKAIIFGLANGIRTNEDFDDPANATMRMDSLPHVVLSTTLSGSEFTSGIGITDELTSNKHLVVDDRLGTACVILDPYLTTSTPHSLWAGTGIKMMADAIEQVYTVRSHPMVDAVALFGVQWLWTYLPLSESEDEGVRMDARLRCQVAAWMSESGLQNARTAVGLAGALRHHLGPISGVNHADATCIMLPHVLEFLAISVPDGYEALARAFGIDSDDRDARARLVVGEVGDFIARLGLPTSLAEVGVRRADFPLLAANTVADPFFLSCPRADASAAEIEELLERAF